MRKVRNGILLFGLAAMPGFAATILFQGTLASDDHIIAPYGEGFDFNIFVSIGHICICTLFLSGLAYL